MKKENTLAYCYECDRDVEYEIKTVEKELEVKDRKFTVKVNECFCKCCGAKVLVSDVEKQNIIKVYDLYKIENGLLTSHDIKTILYKRGMTQKQLASFLSIGEKDITRYINGSIQSRIIDKMLRLVDDDETYFNMVNIFKNASLKSSRTKNDKRLSSVKNI